MRERTIITLIKLIGITIFQKVLNTYITIRGFRYIPPDSWRSISTLYFTCMYRGYTLKQNILLHTASVVYVHVCLMKQLSSKTTHNSNPL